MRNDGMETVVDLIPHAVISQTVAGKLKRNTQNDD